jgi:hypothetical protein
MAAQAGIQSLLLDSRQKHAGMTIWDYGHAILSRGALDLTIHTFPLTAQT